MIFFNPFLKTQSPVFQTEPKDGYSLKETIQFETKFLKVGELFENGHF